jgi:pimeloyl-ACP methyl ester carboxylesterase
VAPPVWGDDDAVDLGLAMASMLVPGDPSGLLGQYQANLAWAERDHLDELAGLAQPALAIAAEHCLIFPPAQVQAAVARMPDARYVELPGAPHLPTSPESNDLVRSSVLAFLAEVHPT